MQYEWDKIKNEINQQKHKLIFEDAYLVFEGECVTFVDDRFAYNESRLITLEDRVVVIVHTPRQNKTRIISMRKASHREQKIYQKRLN